MTSIEMNPNKLDEVLKQLVNQITSSLTKQDKQFLISTAEGDPDWSLYPDPKVKDWPSVKWKLLNINQMAQNKKELHLIQLKEILSI